jgi:hypothetical protein
MLCDIVGIILRRSPLLVCALALASARIAETRPDESNTTNSSGGSQANTWEKDRSNWKVTIYPIFAWAPVFGAHLDVPAPPSEPGAPASSSTVSGTLNGVAAAGFEVLKSGWSVHADGLWGAVSADRDNPKAHVRMDMLFGQFLGGYEVLPHLSLEGGARRMALKVAASIENDPEVTRKPGVWDPLIGMTVRTNLGRKWQFTGHLDGGGFGVGSDVTLAGTARLDWRFTRHFGMTMGASALHFQIADVVNGQKLTARQTMYGPIFGFGIYL